MKRYALALYLVTVLCTAVLNFSFGYTGRWLMDHLLLASLLHGMALFAIGLIRGHKPAAGRLKAANAAAAVYWFIVCLFYTLVLGSNYFWGNTITFDILRQYLGNLSAVLSILPIERWLIITGFILYLLLLAFIFWLIRIRPASSRAISIHTSLQWLNSKKWIILAALVVLVVLGRNVLMSWKRTLHFEQEPITYFSLGPMWEIHSDQLFMSQQPRTPADEACIEDVKPKEKNGKLVIIILVDALRSDHLPMYGYQRNTSPFLDSLYRMGQLQAIPYSYSGSTNTIGGVSSLFFSRSWNSLNLSQLNLMQYFKRSGYSTYAFLTGYHSGWYGLSAMYRTSCDYFYESTSAYNHAVDDDLVTLKKIESTKLQPNSLVYIHLLSTHEIGIRNDPFRVFMPDKIGLTTSQKEPIVNNYDNGILQADYVCRELFADLEKKGLLASSTIFVVGDHGNLMGEDNQYGHAGGLHEKLLEIPILMYSRDSSWRIQRNIGSLMDIAPSITQRMFNDIPACWQGRSFYSSADSVYQTSVSAATVKTAMYNGTITSYRDSIELKIFNKEGVLQSIRRKNGPASWQTIFNK